MLKLLVFSTLVLLLAPPAVWSAQAGTIDGGVGGCELSSPISRCAWQPDSICEKPRAPDFYAGTVREFNYAVNDYNFYLREMQAYKDCLASDAKADITNRVPAIVLDGVKQKAAEADDDLKAAKDALEMARIGLRN